MNIARRVTDWPTSRVEDLIAAGHEHDGADRDLCPAVFISEPAPGQVPETTTA